MSLALGGCGRQPVEEPFFVGVCHVFDEQDVAFANALGCSSFRLGFPWGKVEGPGGEEFLASRLNLLEAAENLDLRVQTVMGYGNSKYDAGGYPRSANAVVAFGRFAGLVAGRTAQFSPLPEVWNEWNLGIGMAPEFGKGEPEDYVPVLAEAYRAIKAEQPEAVVLGGSMAGAGLTDHWTRRACEAGMLEHLDGLSFHPYSYWMQGKAAMPETGMMELIEKLEAVLADFPGGAEVPFYLTEMGWPTHDGVDGVTLEQQAQYAARMLFLMRAHPRVKGVWWFNLNDKDSASSNFNHHFGLRFSDGTPKPSWFAFRDTARFLREVDSAELVETGRGGVRIVRVKLLSGEAALALWAVQPGDQWEFTLDGLGPRATVQLVGSDREFPLQSGSKTVTGGNMPVIVRGVSVDADVKKVRRLRKGGAFLP